MSHPDPNGPPDLTPIQVGEVWENLKGVKTPVRLPERGFGRDCKPFPHRRGTGRLVAFGLFVHPQGRYA